MSTPVFEPEPPGSDAITAYDKGHLVTYLRLLDAHAEGADWQEIVAIVFGIDPHANAIKAQHLYDTQLKRAQWIRDSGYRDLLDGQ